MLRRVRSDLAAADIETRVNAQVARKYWRRLVHYQREVHYPGTSKLYTEIDVELDNFFIEVTTGRGKGKLAQSLRQQNPIANPHGKQNILFVTGRLGHWRRAGIINQGTLVADGTGNMPWELLDIFVN